MYILKKLLQISIIVILLYSNTILAEEKYYFRKTRWGMTKEEVKASETATLIGEEKDTRGYWDKKLSFVGTVREMEVLIEYGFYDNKLGFSRYCFLDDINSSLRHLYEKYNTIKGLLLRKYGNPIVDEILSFSIKDKDGKYYGITLDETPMELVDDYWCMIEFENSKTEITLMLDKKDSSIDIPSPYPIDIRYSSKKIHGVKDF